MTCGTEIRLKGAPSSTRAPASSSVSRAAAYTAGVSYALARLVGALVGLRVDELVEEQGLDLQQHGETGYNL